MNATCIATVGVVIDDALKATGHADDCRASICSAEIVLSQISRPVVS